MGDDLEFQRGVYDKAMEYQSKFNKFDAHAIEEYENKSTKNPLIPDLYQLPLFVAEKVKWQELYELKDNVRLIENSIDTSPLVAYRTARTLHYIVAPKIYSRGGFTMMANNDDLQLTDEDGKRLAPAFPFGSKETETVGAKLIQIPMQKWEIEQAVKLVIEIRKHDKKVAEEEKMMRGDIHRVMEGVWDTYSFQKEPLKRYEENTKDLHCAFGDFSNKLLEELKSRGRKREIIKTFSAGITSIPAALRDRDRRTLLDSVEALSGLADMVATPFQSIFMLLIKAGLVRKDDPEIVEEVVNQMRKLEGMVELWGEKENMNTPFMLVRYNNPI
jgi:hypothetical protein